MCRLNKLEAECSDDGCAIKKDDHLEKDSSDFANQEDIDRSNKFSLKNDLVPSTSKQDVEPRWKIQVGKKHQTYSGPLLPSSMHNNSSERGRTSERFNFLYFDFLFSFKCFCHLKCLKKTAFEICLLHSHLKRKLSNLVFVHVSHAVKGNLKKCKQVIVVFSV